MDGSPPPVRRLALFAVPCALGAVAAAWWSDPLPPSTTPLYALPPLLGGLYLAVAATWIRDVGIYGRLSARAPEAIHAVLQAIGCALAAVGTWMLLALPPAGAGALARTLPELDAYCVGPPGPRLDRDVLPLLDRLESLREGQAAALLAETDRATEALLRRCALQARVALADPEGTHASWRRLRDWMAEHPERHAVAEDDPLWTQAWHERAPPRPSVRAVPVILEP